MVDRHKPPGIELIEELLEEARRLCVVRLAEAGAEEGAFVEPALRTYSGEVAVDPDGLKTPIRKDVAIPDGDGWATFNLDAPILTPREPLVALWDERLTVVLESVTWDYAAFALSPSNQSAGWEELRAWMFNWFDAKEKNSLSEEGVYEVVHFVSDPEINDGGYQLFVDFGSAPIESFRELLACFTRLGFTKCVIGSPKR